MDLDNNQINHSNQTKSINFLRKSIFLFPFFPFRNSPSKTDSWNCSPSTTARVPPRPARPSATSTTRPTGVWWRCAGCTPSPPSTPRPIPRYGRASWRGRPSPGRSVATWTSARKDWSGWSRAPDRRCRPSWRSARSHSPAEAAAVEITTTTHRPEDGDLKNL